MGGESDSAEYGSTLFRPPRLQAVQQPRGLIMTTLVTAQYFGIDEYRATLGSFKTRRTQATRIALDVSRIVPAAPNSEGRGGVLHCGRLFLYSHGHLHLPLGTQLCAPGLE